MKKLPLLILLIIIVLSACSHPQKSITRSNDIIRIDSSVALTDKYSTLPNSKEKRNSYYLEGTVLKVEKRARRLNCPPNNNDIFVVDTFVVFLDKKADDKQIERINIKDIIFIGQKIDDYPMNEYQNINLFEKSNDPFLPNSISTVKVDSIYVPCPEETPCPCGNLNVDYDLELEINCPKCQLDWWFLELNYINSIFSDYQFLEADFKYRNVKHFEAAAGFRFNQTQIGLLYNPWFEVNNYYDNTKENKPLLALYGKHKFAPFLCMNPYVYGLLGTAIDKTTFDYIGNKAYQPNNSTNCISNFGFPLSYGFGIGIDAPIPSCLFNFTFDIGYRSLAVGQRLLAPPLDEQLSIRRLDVWNFRIGISLGNK